MSTEEFQRKLTAILSADVQGYSHLMGEDEDSTVHTLKAYRELMSSLIERYHGRVVDSPGDNLLSEFESVRDAVRCAFDIQEELRIRNEELPENRRMRFRIGINLGDVIKDGDRIYGDGINVAARVEGLAEGGGISISGTVYDSIKNKLAMHYEFQGEHSVKNIKDPVRVYRVRVEPETAKSAVKEKKTGISIWQRAVLPVLAAIILGVVAVWYFSFRQGPVVSDVEESPKTIAVLPFDDISPENDQEYFVDGLSEEILNSLTKIPNLYVTSRTSSFYFKNTETTIQKIADVLNVSYILEGSVRKAGTELRITAQLIRVADDRHLWSETYDRKFEDIFAVQEDIAKTVADELKATLGFDTSLRQLGGTNNKEAYELYLIAKGQISSAASYEDWKRILNSIDQVFPIDPEFAMAWDLKSKAHIQLSLTGPNSQVAAERDAAHQAAQKAIKLEPNLGSAYIKLGFIEWAKGHWIDAESYFREALELSHESLSGDDDYLVAFYNSVGNFKRAQDLIELIRRYDPLHTGYRGHAMYNLAYIGDTQGAEEEYERCRATFGDNAWHNRVITLVRFGSGNIVSREDIVVSDPFIDVAKKHLGSPEEALSELRRYNINSDVNVMSSLFICAAYFNDPEYAMDEIEETLRVHPEGSFHIWLPVMHEVRQLPRFKELVREIGLVDYWEQFGWPDICQPTDDGDFVCD